jgi:hypothetical protein
MELMTGFSAAEALGREPGDIFGMTRVCRQRCTK